MAVVVLARPHGDDLLVVVVSFCGSRAEAHFGSSCEARVVLYSEEVTREDEAGRCYGTVSRYVTVSEWGQVFIRSCLGRENRVCIVGLHLRYIKVTVSASNGTA